MIETLEQLLTSEEPDEPFSIVVSADEVVAVVSRRGDKLPLPLDGLSVTITPDAVTLGGESVFAGVPIVALIGGTPRLEDGGIRFDLASIELNGKPGPPFMLVQVGKKLNERLSSTELPFLIETLELADGSALISGRTRLRG